MSTRPRTADTVVPFYALTREGYRVHLALRQAVALLERLNTRNLEIFRASLLELLAGADARAELLEELAGQLEEAAWRVGRQDGLDEAAATAATARRR